MFLEFDPFCEELDEETSNRVLTIMNLIAFFKEVNKDQYFDYFDSYGNHLFTELDNLLEPDGPLFTTFLYNNIDRLPKDQQKLARDLIPNYQITDIFCRNSSESFLGFEAFKAFCFFLQTKKILLLDVVFCLLDSFSSLILDINVTGEKLPYEQTAFSNSKDYLKSLSNIMIFSRNGIFD